MHTKQHQGAYRLFELLEMPPGGLSLTNVEYRRWGRDCTLSMCYEQDGVSLPFRIKLFGCTEIHWDVHGEDHDIDDYANEADVIGVVFNSKIDLAQISITTVVVEVAVIYSRLVLEKDVLETA